MKKLSAILLVFLVGCAFWPNAAAAQDIISPNETLSVMVGQGNLIKLQRPASGVFIADPNVADVQAQSDSVVYVFGKNAGNTTLFAVDPDDNVITKLNIHVLHNVAALNDALDTLIGSQIRVSSIQNGLVMLGSAQSPTEVEDARLLVTRFLGEDEQIINRVSLNNPIQVNLHVRVAEVSRTVSKVFGINWETLLSPGDFVFGFANGRNLLPNTFNRLVDQEGAAGGALASYQNDNVSIDAVVDALEREGFITVLAQPNLTALSGETASFLAGGEFPVPVGVDDGDIQIEFKEFGVSLDFTPTVLSGERISLKVRPEVSELSDNGAITLESIEIPALATRRAETTVELRHGQSFAIGGLVSNSTRNSVERFPGLGEIPVLGTLFRSNDFQRRESELVIIITPYLVKPLAENNIRTPLDGIRAPSDYERIFNGDLFINEDAQTSGGQSLDSANQPTLSGYAGFILE